VAAVALRPEVVVEEDRQLRLAVVEALRRLGTRPEGRGGHAGAVPAAQEGFSAMRPDPTLSAPPIALCALAPAPT